MLDWDLNLFAVKWTHALQKRSHNKSTIDKQELTNSRECRSMSIMDNEVRLITRDDPERRNRVDEGIFVLKTTNWLAWWSHVIVALLVFVQCVLRNIIEVCPWVALLFAQVSNGENFKTVIFYNIIAFLLCALNGFTRAYVLEKMSFKSRTKLKWHTTCWKLFMGFLRMKSFKWWGNCNSRLTFAEF